MYFLLYCFGGLALTLGWALLWAVRQRFEQNPVRTPQDIQAFHFAIWMVPVGSAFLWFAVVNTFTWEWLSIFLQWIIAISGILFIRYAWRVYTTRPATKQNTGYMIH